MDKAIHTEYRRGSITGHRILLVNTNPSLKITIKAMQKKTRDNTLTILGKNLYNGEYNYGYLKSGQVDLINTKSELYRTTTWFPITPQGKSLVLSGTAHNRSTWQFKLADGSIITDVGLSQKYKVASDVLHDKTISKVDIPQGAEYARVYFACFKDESASSLDDRMQIEYGKVPTHYEPYVTKEIPLPKLKLSQWIEYENGEWFLLKGRAKKQLDIPPLELRTGDTLMVKDDTLSIALSWATESNGRIATGLYGVRWNRKDPNPVCERIGDSKGLHFNYRIDGDDATPYQNDFDRIYPWSDIRVCAISMNNDGTRNIIYENDEGFRKDGSVGNIMVELPKFYCKRELIHDYEYLWISATPREGFSLDPSFQTEQGILDYVYIGAYLSGVKDNQLFSHSNSFPLIKESLAQLRSYIANSDGFTECDVLTILTVQKLYLVETAVLDSQSLFTGNVYLPYILKDKSTSYYAIESGKATNRIIVRDAHMTRRFRIGDAVSILDGWNEFQNEPERYQREITEINDISEETLEIKFTGDPVDIVEGETGITCIPCKTGETDHIPYATGCIEGRSGHVSFKYRGIENLWGNVFILLDGAYVKNSQLYLNYPTGNTVKISYSLPIQNVQLSLKQFGDPDNMIVKRMGYDEDHPLIMFPCEIGNGATTFSYYCDGWYNLGEEDVTYVITYGGAWDNKGYAGIFNFRATFTEDSAIPFNGSRLMLR